jgi:hypothetical protein
VKPECRYIARLAFMGHELWRCRHRHEKDREARRCGFEAWRLLCVWLAADDVAALEWAIALRKGQWGEDHGTG